jgi:HrpA-like RNA helicase
MFQTDDTIDNSVLYACLDPPSEESVSAAESALTRLGALDDDNQRRITWLGQHLAQIPCDPSVGKMLIYGSILQCVSTVSTVAACIALGDPFVVPSNSKVTAAKERFLFFVYLLMASFRFSRNLSGKYRSDLLVYAEAVRQYRLLANTGDSPILIPTLTHGSEKRFL